MRSLFKDLILDAVDFVRGKQEENLPPRWIRRRWAGKGDFKEIGEKFLKYLIELCRLTPESSILDIGCGAGRMAIPLTRFFNTKGRYEGIDVACIPLRWCKRNIERRHPNFHFRKLDVYSGVYNPLGKRRGADVEFPFGEESFDVVLAASLFTHLLQEDVENYIKEMYRVLKKGGRSLSTWFLLNEESLGLIEGGKSSLKFKAHPGSTFYKVLDIHRPEKGIAYTEKWVRELFKKTGFVIEAIHYGSWCGRKEYLNGQDIIVARKP